VPRQLVGLLTDCPGIDQLVPRGMPLPDYACHCPIVSLPFRLGTTLDTIPAPIPYLSVHPRRVAKWEGRLQAISGFKVGIAWQDDADERLRTPTLEQFAPLAQSPLVALIAVREGPDSEPAFPLHDLPGLDEDGNAFMDAAAVMRLMDLVVTADTAIAHLAGALGIRVWVVLPFVADWRWLNGREDSPWYPSMRLFRQDRPDDWAGVFQRLSAALALEVQKAHPAPPALDPLASTGARKDKATDEAYMRGLKLIKQNQFAEGEACLREVIRHQPERWETYVNLGVALARQQKFEDAIGCFERYVEARPQAVEGFNNLGLAYVELGQFPEAEKAFFQAVRLQPDNADTHNNLGVCRMRQDKYEEAIAAFEQARQLMPDRAASALNLGNAFRNKKDFPKAIHYYTEATRIQPPSAEVLCSIGMAYSQLRDRARSAEYYRKALLVDPDCGDAHNNLGVALADFNSLEEAEFHLKEALRVRPEHAETHRNLGIIQLMAGKFEEGWAEYEWRRRMMTEPHDALCPRWDGSSLAGRTLLLYSEQGLGDVLQFIRYAAVAQKAGGKVVFECPPILTSLLSGQAGINQVIPRGAPLPHVDVSAPLLSLPFLFGTRLDSVPAQVPYLEADSERVESWRASLRHLRGLKVAIAWQGSPKYAGDFQRSIPLDHFADLAEIPHVQLISLQKDFGAEQLGPAAKRFVPIDLGRQIDQDGKAFVDSAAIMELVDLVITSDTAIAHLAGALGVPVWLVLHFAADWRWLRGRDDCPWYPTMRLFRQETSGDWTGVFRRVADALRQ
jgi:tetratricopeptide (TPR) repeat protein